VKNPKKAYIGALGCAGTVYAFATGILTSNMLLSYLLAVVQNQVVQVGFLYMFGQWLNNVMTRKNFGKFQAEVLTSIDNFSLSMTKSLKEVAEALRADLATKASRSEMQAGFDKVNRRIDILEAKQKV
jgi:hypothetical protein